MRTAGYQGQLGLSWHLYPALAPKDQWECMSLVPSRACRLPWHSAGCALTRQRAPAGSSPPAGLEPPLAQGKSPQKYTNSITSAQTPL